MNYSNWEIFKKSDISLYNGKGQLKSKDELKIEFIKSACKFSKDKCKLFYSYKTKLLKLKSMDEKDKLLLDIFTDLHESFRIDYKNEKVVYFINYVLVRGKGDILYDINKLNYRMILRYAFKNKFINLKIKTLLESHSVQFNDTVKNKLLIWVMKGVDMTGDFDKVYDILVKKLKSMYNLNDKSSLLLSDDSHCTSIGSMYTVRNMGAKGKCKSYKKH